MSLVYCKVIFSAGVDGNVYGWPIAKDARIDVISANNRWENSRSMNTVYLSLSSTCLSTSIHLCIFTFIFIHRSKFISLCISISLSISIFSDTIIYLSICLSIYLSIYVSIYLCIYLSFISNLLTSHLFLPPSITQCPFHLSQHFNSGILV